MSRRLSVACVATHVTATLVQRYESPAGLAPATPPNASRLNLIGASHYASSIAERCAHGSPIPTPSVGRSLPSHSLAKEHKVYCCSLYRNGWPKASMVMTFLGPAKLLGSPFEAAACRRFATTWRPAICALSDWAANLCRSPPPKKNFSTRLTFEFASGGPSATKR